MFTSFQRAFKFALSDFSRNVGRSISAIFVLVITIMFLTGLLFLHGVSDYVISQVQNKIDITAYFKADSTEQEMLDVQANLKQDFPDIKNIEYVSKEDALEKFTTAHKDDKTFSNALEQVGDNPFLPALNITTSGSTAQYESLANALAKDKYADAIEKVDFSDKKATIDKIFSITSTFNTFGLILGIILTLVVILVVFNTIKLAIEASKDEISTMTIVGASSWFVRAPFIIQGMLFGLVSFAFCFCFTAYVAYFSSKTFIGILGGFNLWSFFISNLLWVILIQLVLAVALGVISSWIVVQKYLKV